MFFWFRGLRAAEMTLASSIAAIAQGKKSHGIVPGFPPPLRRSQVHPLFRGTPPTLFFTFG